MTVGERIRTRRIELGMSQAELAQKVGYKEKATISKIEADGRTLRQSKILLFAQALQTTPLWLMGWEDEPEVSTDDMFFELVKDMSDEEKIELKNYINYIISKRK